MGFSLDFLEVSLGDPQGAYISRVSAFLEVSLRFSLVFLPVSLGFSLDFPRGPPGKTCKFIGVPWGLPLDFLWISPERELKNKQEKFTARGPPRKT